MKKITLLVCLLSILPISKSLSQPQPGRNVYQLTPKQIANQKTSHLERELSLTDKQAKKVYKLYLNQAKKAQQSQSNENGATFGGPPPGGGRDMGERPGPPPMGKRPDRGEGRREGHPGLVHQESEKDIAKREEKMKKILSVDQYQRWIILEEEVKSKEKDRRHKEELKRQFPELDLEIQ